MAIKFESRLGGTMLDYFRIGAVAANVRLKNVSGTLNIRTGTDSAHADLTTKSIKLHGTNASFGITFAAPAGLAANVTLTWPSDDGATGQVLYTDGAGGLYWAAPAAGAVTLVKQDFTQATSSPVTLFTPSDNAKLLRFKVIVSSPASGGSPTISIGYSGSVAAYMTTADNDLKTAGEYIVDEYYQLGVSPAAVTATIVVSGQTFTGTILAEWSS